MARKMPGETAIRERFEEVAAIYREICTAPEYAGYFEKTPCLPAMASRRQLNDRSKARAPEIEQMRRVAEEIEELNSTTRHLMTESGIDSYVRAARPVPTKKSIPSSEKTRMTWPAGALLGVNTTGAESNSCR